MTQITGNKGDWSEIYALFKLLGDGVMYAGDGDLNKIDDLFYPIISIVRKEQAEYRYSPDTERNIVFISSNGDKLAEISMDKFLQEAEYLIDRIKQSKSRAFAIPGTETFMSVIGCSQLKAPHSDKSDIHIIIHDLRTGMKPELGFSIKSQLGSNSTLLNASRSTNVVYRLSGDLSDDDYVRINSISGQSERMQQLKKMGITLVFDHIEQETFFNNLRFIDFGVPSIVAECLNVFFTEGISDIKAITKIVASRNPLKCTHGNIYNFYCHKIKQLLLDVALGMVPATLWDGRYDANGGYIVVRKDGEIVCFHFYNRNDVEDYLFNHTKLERASRSRHDYGHIYKGGDNVCRMALNLQIRFK